MTLTNSETLANAGFVFTPQLTASLVQLNPVYGDIPQDFLPSLDEIKKATVTLENGQLAFATPALPKRFITSNYAAAVKYIAIIGECYKGVQVYVPQTMEMLQLLNDENASVVYCVQPVTERKQLAKGQKADETEEETEEETETPKGKKDVKRTILTDVFVYAFPTMESMMEHASEGAFALLANNFYGNICTRIANAQRNTTPEGMPKTFFDLLAGSETVGAPKLPTSISTAIATALNTIASSKPSYAFVSLFTSPKARRDMLSSYAFVTHECLASEITPPTVDQMQKLLSVLKMHVSKNKSEDVKDGLIWLDWAKSVMETRVPRNMGKETASEMDDSLLAELD